MIAVRDGQRVASVLPSRWLSVDVVKGLCLADAAVPAIALGESNDSDLGLCLAGSVVPA